MTHRACHQVPMDHCKNLTIEISKKVCTVQQVDDLGDFVEKANGGKKVLIKRDAYGAGGGRVSSP